MVGSFCVWNRPGAYLWLFVVTVFMYATWSGFSLCWGLSKTNWGVFQVAEALERKEGFWVVWTAKV